MRQRLRRRNRLTVVVSMTLAALMLAGCFGDGDTNGDTASEPQPTATVVAAPTTTPLPSESPGPTTTTEAVATTTPAPGEPALPSPTGVPEAPPTPPMPAEVPIVLRGDGLGLAAFGEDPDEVFAILNPLYGRPTSDTTLEWSSDRDPVGVFNGLPANHYLRTTEWDPIGLGIIVSDGVEWPDGRQDPVLIGWSCCTPDAVALPETAGGITVGSVVADLEAAFGDGLTYDEVDDDADPSTPAVWVARLSGPAVPGTVPTVFGASAYLSGDPTDANTVVTALTAGVAVAP